MYQMKYEEVKEVLCKTRWWEIIQTVHLIHEFNIDRWRLVTFDSDFNACENVFTAVVLVYYIEII